MNVPFICKRRSLPISSFFPRNALLIVLSGFRLNVFLFNFSFFKASGLSLYFAPLGIVVVVL